MCATIGKLKTPPKNPEPSQIDRLPLPPQPPYHPKGGPIGILKKKELGGLCPWAYGLDDLVLQSGLYSMCAAHERPFCYSYTEHIR